MATYSGSYIIGSIGRIGSLLYATIGWTNNETPNLSSTPYQLFDCYSSVLSAENVRKAQVAYINLAEYPFNLLDSLGIVFKVEVNGTEVFSREYLGPSLVYNPALSLARIVDWVNSQKTLSDMQTAFGGAGTSYKKSFAYEIQFVYYADAILKTDKTAMVNPNTRSIYKKRVEFSSGVYIRAASGTTAGSNTPIYAPSGTPAPTITETDGIKSYLVEKFAAYNSGSSSIETALNSISAKIGTFGTGSGAGSQVSSVREELDEIADRIGSPSVSLADDLASVANDATSAAAVVQDQTYGNQAIKNSLDVLTSDHSTEMYYISDTRSKVTDIQTKVNGTDQSSGSGTIHIPGIAENAASAVSVLENASYGNSAIKSAVDSAASSAASAASDAGISKALLADGSVGLAYIAAQATNSAGYSYSALNTVQNVAYGNSAIKTAVSGVGSDVASVLSLLGTPAGASISADIASVSSGVGSVATNLGTFGTGSGLGSDVADAREALEVIAERIGTPASGTSVADDTAAIRQALGDETDGLGAISDAVVAVQATADGIVSTLGTPAGTSLAADIAAVAGAAAENASAIAQNSSRTNGLIHAVEKNTTEIHQLKREVK